MPERVIGLSRDVSALARKSLSDIQRVTGVTKMLSINALVEAARAGDAGRGFAIVAEEVGRISRQIDGIAVDMGEQLAARVAELERLGHQLVAQVRGARLTDLALNMIEIIDRNLYERSCDVRWWATDSAVVQLAAQPTPESARYAAERLGVILDSYTVYLDIWVADLNGRVLANGRPGKYPRVKGANVANEPWFRKSLETRSGAEFAVADVVRSEMLGGRTVATYAATVREAGRADGKPRGVLGIFFDWQAQSDAVVKGVRLLDDEKTTTRCLIVDKDYKVIAASDAKGVLTEIFRLDTAPGKTGSYPDGAGNLVGYALTPGYETYKGLGWYGVICQKARARAEHAGCGTELNGARLRAAG
jgi:hypothetical protein